MKQLLKLLFVLSGTIISPLTVIACGQESLDSNLNILYNGETKYDINQITDKKISEDIIENFELSKSETDKMAKNIANFIFEKNNLKTNITWYDETTKINEKCYHFNVIPETERKNPEKDPFIWKVQATNGRFIVKISYLVGTTDNENKFIANQKIDKSFEVKVAKSQSDKDVTTWIDYFNNNIDWDKTPITINLTKTEIELPEINITWESLDEKLIAKTKQVIYSELEKIKPAIPGKNIISIKDEKVTKEMIIKVKISVNLTEAKKETKPFLIKFTKEK